MPTHLWQSVIDKVELAIRAVNAEVSVALDNSCLTHIGDSASRQDIGLRTYASRRDSRAKEADESVDDEVFDTTLPFPELRTPRAG